MGYADLDTVARLIAPEGGAEAFGDDDAAMARLEQINDAMSTVFDQKVLGGNVAPVGGALFGGTAAASARVIPGGTVAGEAILTLSMPVRSVSSVVITGDWAETVAASEYVLVYPTLNGSYLGIRRIAGGGWPPNNGRSTITVTGLWGDSPMGGDVPDIVVEALNFVVMEQYRLEIASPGEEIGPDGVSVKPRNPWNFELVKEAIARYRVPLTPAGF